MSKDSNVIKIYTDGACSGNPGPGGWGAVLMWNGHEKELNGGTEETTNNRMEMQAVIEALKALKRPSIVELYTDSVYVQKGITEWIHSWKAKNWPSKIKNKDLWQEMDTLVAQHDINFHWIKGHAGHPENERADELARNGIPK